MKNVVSCISYKHRLDSLKYKGFFYALNNTPLMSFLVNSSLCL